MKDSKKIYTLKNHKVQRYIFSNEEFLKDFLSSILPIVDYTKEVIKVNLCVEKLETPASVYGKECSLDLYIEVNDDIIVLIELYNDFDLDDLVKTEYNGYEAHHEYNNVPFKNIFGIEKLKTYTFRIDNLSDFKYTKTISNKAKMWLEMYSIEGEKALEDIKKRAHEKGYDIMEKCVERINGFWNDPFIKNAESQEKRELRKYIAREVDKEAGKKTIEIANEMGMDFEFINKATKMPIDEIKKLQVC